MLLCLITRGFSIIHGYQFNMNVNHGINSTILEQKLNLINIHIVHHSVNHKSVDKCNVLGDYIETKIYQIVRTK